MIAHKTLPWAQIIIMNTIIVHGQIAFFCVIQLAFPVSEK